VTKLYSEAQLLKHVKAMFLKLNTVFIKCWLNALKN